MTSLLDSMLIALQYAAIGLALFIVSYASNMCFSIYYNIKVLGETFNKSKLLNSGFKILTFGIGTFLMTVATVGIPEFANLTGIELPEEYVKVFSTLAIAGVFIYCSCKYILESFGKFKKILDAGNFIHNIENDIKKEKNNEVQNKEN